MAETLRKDPDAFGLRAALVEAGQRLIEAWEWLQEGDDSPLGSSPGTAAEWDGAFAARFVDAVAGDGSTVATAAVRRATAGPILDRLIAGLGGEGAEEASPNAGMHFPDDLFCAIYELFFADAVSEFIKTIIAEKIKLAVPVLHVIDPAGHVASWVAERIRAVLPLPCEAKADAGEGAPSIADLGRDLLVETVDRALGIAPGDGTLS
ncbi:hypothetical protein [Actinomadura opuntiae]|uniref:hypothetical protein n=1 Tax=Actinomadura sp. OS1-43 TaxID=604315 RepID=UPI00255A8983|nr:hypothetical protein [Actinomadura sp. OS1-43]MDL4819101.1 hypothetical protein [Actinomadura sp. OS1-43]